MSEYIEFDYEYTDDPHQVLAFTNVALTPDGELEIYESRETGDEGSPLAQALFEIPGLVALTLQGSDMHITRDAEVPWHDLIEDIRDALRDFFL